MIFHGQDENESEILAVREVELRNLISKLSLLGSTKDVKKKFVKAISREIMHERRRRRKNNKGITNLCNLKKV